MTVRHERSHEFFCVCLAAFLSLNRCCRIDGKDEMKNQLTISPTEFDCWPATDDVCL